MVTSVYASNGNVYVADYEDTGPTWQAQYFKNDDVVYLSDRTSDVWANSIFVYGTDVYVAGRARAGAAWELKAWKNGDPVTLTNVTSITPASVAGIFVL